MIHKHHRKRRSQGGDDSPANIMLVPDELHAWIHEHPEAAYELGWLVKSFDQPDEISIEIPVEILKKQRKKKTESEAPRQREVIAVRVPKDERENGAEVLDTLIDSARKKLAPAMGWDEDVPAYYVLAAVLADWLTTVDHSDPLGG